MSNENNIAQSEETYFVKKHKTLEDYIAEVDYLKFENTYMPSNFALEFISFIKMVNNGVGEENKSPLFHLEIIDTITAKNVQHILVVSFRGSSKTTLMEYLILYIGTFGHLPNFGKVHLGIYISDTMDNGVKNMKNNLQHRFHNSDFLQSLLDTKRTRFNQDEWEFVNKDGHMVTFRGFGINTGVRGFKKYGKRPEIAIFDDLISDQGSTSDTIIESIENTIYKAVKNAMHPTRKKIIWIGTPFNKKDPLYKAAASGAWKVKVYPICQKFPIQDKEKFIPAWEDRFNKEEIKSTYEFYKNTGRLDAFNGELMLRILSDEDRLVKDDQIVWYDNRLEIIARKDDYSWYITTDFATSEKKKADYTVLSVWALSNEKKWYWVDGVLARQELTKTINDLFRLVAMYGPIRFVAIEVSGQQQGFISVIKKEMIDRNIFFALANDKKSGEPGIRPNTSKLERFNVVLPLIQNKRILFPSDLRYSPIMIEAEEELSNVTYGGFKSVHDDFCDTISQIPFLPEIVPSGLIITPEQQQTQLQTYNIFSLATMTSNRNLTNYDSYLAN